MAELKWDQDTQRLYETGTSHGVLYPKKNDGTYDKGVAWNGLTAVSESPSGAEETALYADDKKYLSLRSAEEFGATIEAYTYPDEFAECDGSVEAATGLMLTQQNRKKFGFSYRTLVGDDVDGTDLGYKLHIVYGCLAAPTDKGYSTVNDSPEAITFSWEISTTPVEIVDENGAQIGSFKPTAHVVIDSTKADPTKLAALEDILYGTASTEPRLPEPYEIIDALT